MTDEEAIFAYIDGELKGADRSRIEAAINADPALQVLVAEHRALADQLRGAFSTISDAPVPIVHCAAIMPEAEIVSLAQARSHREQGRPTWSPAHWGALAATLVAGMIGGAMFSDGRPGPIAEQGGRLVAAGGLERALNTQLASTQDGKAPVRVGLTFRNHGGAICRSFTAQAGEGVACRERERWRLHGFLAGETGATGEYRMAASSGAAELVDGLIVGDAMEPAQERAARAAGWKP